MLIPKHFLFLTLQYAHRSLQLLSRGMQSLIKAVRGRTSPSGCDDVSMPLHTMRTSDDAPLNERDHEGLEEGDEDNDPLLPSAAGTLERVKAEIEHELGSSGGDTAYDRRSDVSLRVDILGILKFSSPKSWRRIPSCLCSSFYREILAHRITCCSTGLLFTTSC
jgi:hypothetical protein